MVHGKKILITGGAGFIGSHLAERLISENEVIIYDNFSRNAIKYSQIQEEANLKLVSGDVLNAELLDKNLEGVDICIHAAAIAGIYSVGTSVTKTIKVNLIGAYNALEASVRQGVKQFVDFSTSEVYGPYVFRGKESDQTTQGPLHEKRWVYAVSKLASEYLTHAYGHEHSINISTIRPFNVYGPRQVGEGAIQQMILKAMRGDEITVYNDGTQIRSWCFVSDFIDCLYKIILKNDKETQNQIFNIGNPQSTTTILNLAEMIKEMTDSRSKISFKPHPGPEVEIRVPDITNARNILGYEPQVNLKAGLASTIAWFKENLELIK